MTADGFPNGLLAVGLARLSCKLADERQVEGFST